MNIHEYQAKEVLQKYGIPIPAFGVATQAHEVEKVIRDLQLSQGVVKIQVHAGGRGKAGGVKFGKTSQEIMQVAEQLIGMRMVNDQTGPDGVIARAVLITQPVHIKKEYYLGAVIDRQKGVPILIASPEGGVEIEEVAAEHPDRILQLPIELDGTLRRFRQVRLCNFMGWKGEQAQEGARIARGLAKAFIDTDASLLEINPFVEAEDGKFWALDAKLSLDDNALYRQSALAAYYDPTQVSAQEVAAQEFELAYIALDGNIGCMVNGAGLAMATMDIIQHYGGKPANFLDVGGGASKEKVAEAFKIIVSDPKVKAILVNIFGGIMNCATLAEGIITAASQMAIRVPLVVRMEGTNVEEGKKLLQHSQLAIVTADTLAEAAKKVCATLQLSHKE